MIDLLRVRGTPLPPGMVSPSLSHAQFVRQTVPQHMFWQPQQAAALAASALSIQQQMQRAAHSLTLDSLPPTKNNTTVSPGTTTQTSNGVGTGTTTASKTNVPPPGTWSASVTYNAGQIVLYGGNTYAAEVQNSGQTPSWYSTYWALIGPATTDQLKNGTSTSTLLTTMVDNGNIGGSFHNQVGVDAPVSWYPLGSYPSGSNDLSSLRNNLTLYQTVAGGTVSNGASLIPGNSYSGSTFKNALYYNNAGSGPTLEYYTFSAIVGLSATYPSTAEPIFGLNNWNPGGTVGAYEPSCWIGLNGHLYAAAYFSGASSPQTVLDAGWVDWSSAHHVVVTCSNSTLTVFLDGVQRATVSPSGGTHVNSLNNLWLGGMYANGWTLPNLSGIYIAGGGMCTIQEASLWFSVLSNQTILQLYQAWAAGAQSADLIPSGSESTVINSSSVESTTKTIANQNLSATLQLAPQNFYPLGSIV